MNKYVNRASLGVARLDLTPIDPEFLAEHYYAQYSDRYKKVEPYIHAFVDEENRADRISSHSRHRPADFLQPSLFGIPVGVKDLIHIDGLLTRAGSKLPPAELTGNEGWLVKTLKLRGAWIAGKTVTEEFAYAGNLPTRNPHNLNHTSGGSSAGSAAAVAAGICPLAIGTQTLRSVTAPASFCGVVGFKPSYGRIPMDGVLLLSPSLDTMGLFTQDLESMELSASALVPNWTPFLSDRKPVLGIPDGVYMTLLDEETKRAFQEQIRTLEQAGFIIKKTAMPWDDNFIYGDALLHLVQGEMAQIHQPLFAKYKECYHPAVQQAIVSGQTIDESELERYRQVQGVLRNDLLDVQSKQGIDIWVSPSQAGTAPLWGERTGWTGMIAIWTYAGSPTISIPAATLNHMPLGFQCIGHYGQDEELLHWAKVVDSHLHPDKESL